MKLLDKVIKKINRLENWFNNKFGWFFTNGNKTIQK